MFSTHPLRSGDSLDIIFPPEKSSETLIGEDIALDIRYEDSDILVIEKPPFR